MHRREQTLPRVEIEPDDERLDYLTSAEVNFLTTESANGCHDKFRRCCLGILHAGLHIDDSKELFEKHADFDVEIDRRVQGIMLVLLNAPELAFIDGTLKESLREHLCAAAIDLIYHAKQVGEPRTSEEITDAVFRILRHDRIFEMRDSSSRNVHKQKRRNLSRIVCWGGHSISPEEYAYTKAVGMQLAERYAELITGCGPGAMRGPFSGAVAGYEAQRIGHARKIGFTCPGIITSEPPNSFVDPLVILPDIEKRLEAFVRASMGCVVFPGGPGTAEEIQTILAILLHERNNNQQYPVILTGPESARGYFEAINDFLHKTIGKTALNRPKPKYEIIIDDPRGVAEKMMERVEKAQKCRDANEDTPLWYRSLHFPSDIQQPFYPTHENVGKLRLHRDQEPYQVAAQLRRLFSAVVYGNVTDTGIHLIEKQGPFTFEGDETIIQPLDEMLRRFTQENRMKVRGDYVPCYALRKQETAIDLAKREANGEA